MLKSSLWALLVIPLIEARISRDGKCGGSSRATCQGSVFGNCCSRNGWCGSKTDYCGKGCNTTYGSCNTVASPSPIRISVSPSPAASSVPSTPQLKHSVNARCGFAHDALPGGMTCLGSRWGDCCRSVTNFCWVCTFC